MFNLSFGKDDFIYDVSREELLSIFEWRGIEIEELDLKALSQNNENKEIVKIFSKYCKIEENIGEGIYE